MRSMVVDNPSADGGGISFLSHALSDERNAFALSKIREWGTLWTDTCHESGDESPPPPHDELASAIVAPWPHGRDDTSGALLLVRDGDAMLEYDDRTDDSLHSDALALLSELTAAGIRDEPLDECDGDVLRFWGPPTTLVQGLAPITDHRMAHLRVLVLGQRASTAEDWARVSADVIRMTAARFGSHEACDISVVVRARGIAHTTCLIRLSTRDTARGHMI